MILILIAHQFNLEFKLPHQKHTDQCNEVTVYTWFRIILFKDFGNLQDESLESFFEKIFNQLSDILGSYTINLLFQVKNSLFDEHIHVIKYITFSFITLKIVDKQNNKHHFKETCLQSKIMHKLCMSIFHKYFVSGIQWYRQRVIFQTKIEVYLCMHANSVQLLLTKRIFIW
jgi:hypothetical protein